MQSETLFARNGDVVVRFNEATGRHDLLKGAKTVVFSDVRRDVVLERHSSSLMTCVLANKSELRALREAEESLARKRAEEEDRLKVLAKKEEEDAVLEYAGVVAVDSAAEAGAVV